MKADEKYDDRNDDVVAIDQNRVVDYPFLP